MALSGTTAPSRDGLLHSDGCVFVEYPWIALGAAHSFLQDGNRNHFV